VNPIGVVPALGVRCRFAMPLQVSRPERCPPESPEFVSQGRLTYRMPTGYRSRPRSGKPLSLRRPSDGTDARVPDRWLSDRRLQRLSDAHFRAFITSLVWSVSNRTKRVIEPEIWG